MAWRHGIAIQHPRGFAEPLLDGSLSKLWSFVGSGQAVFVLDLRDWEACKACQGWEA